MTTVLVDLMGMLAMVMMTMDGHARRNRHVGENPNSRKDGGIFLVHA